MESNFFKCIDYICKYIIRSQIGLLQVPHHGSRYNYDKSILYKPIHSSFINFNSNQKADASIKEIENDFYMTNRPCFEITQDKESRYEQLIFWDNFL